MIKRGNTHRELRTTSVLDVFLLVTASSSILKPLPLRTLEDTFIDVYRTYNFKIVTLFETHITKGVDYKFANILLLNPLIKCSLRNR